MAFQDFARARVAHMRPHGVGHVRGHIDDGRIAGVFEAPCGIFFRGRCHFADDGVFESGLFESRLPVVHPGDQVGHPLFRGGGVDVEDDRLGGFDQFAAFISLHVFGFRFQPPTGDHPDVFNPLRILVVVDIVVGEEPDARVEITRLHRRFGQQDQRAVDFVGRGHRTGFVTGEAALGGDDVAACAFHLDVFRKGFDSDDIGFVFLESSDIQVEFVGVVETGQFGVAADKVGRVYQQGVFRLVGAFDFERGDDRLHVGTDHGLVHVAGGVARHLAGGDVFDKEFFLVGRLPQADHVLADGVAGVTEEALPHIGGGFRDTVHDEHVAPHQRGGDQKVVFPFLLDDGEKPVGPLGAGLDYRFDASFGRSGFLRRGIGCGFFASLAFLRFNGFPACRLLGLRFGRGLGPVRCSQRPGTDHCGQGHDPDLVHIIYVYGFDKITTKLRFVSPAWARVPARERSRLKLAHHA